MNFMVSSLHDQYSADTQAEGSPSHLCLCVSTVLGMKWIYHNLAWNSLHANRIHDYISLVECCAHFYNIANYICNLASANIKEGVNGKREGRSNLTITISELQTRYLSIHLYLSKVHFSFRGFLWCYVRMHFVRNLYKPGLPPDKASTYMQ